MFLICECVTLSKLACYGHLSFILIYHKYITLCVVCMVNIMFLLIDWLLFFAIILGNLVICMSLCLLSWDYLCYGYLYICIVLCHIHNRSSTHYLYCCVLLFVYFLYHLLVSSLSFGWIVISKLFFYVFNLVIHSL
jgi:hypothetical protein